MVAAFLLMLQAAAPQQQVALASAAQASAPEVQDRQDALPEQPAPQKRVCRSFLDTRVGLIAKKQTVCRTVPAADPARK